MITVDTVYPCCGGAEPCGSGTEEGQKRPGIQAATAVPVRPRFFAGQLVTDADLRAIVEYQRAQLALALATCAGWGVHSGYALGLDEDGCGVVVGPGVAVDARGRALVHGGSTRVTRPDPAQLAITSGAPPQETSYLAVAYDDLLGGARPRYGSGCGPSAKPGSDFSRVEERVRFVWLDRLPDAYWTKGTVPEPCADAAPLPEPNAAPYERKTEAEPKLDVCTPPIGVRGGAGVSEYARRLAHAWNLPRNAAVIGGPAPTTPGAAASAGPGVGALLDVISGVAAAPRSGDPLVVLAQVTFSTVEGRPHLEVAPLRRRVLSAADLTYLVAWMLERMLAGPAPGVTPEVERNLPPSAVTCGAPPVAALCDTARLLGVAAAGEGAPERVIERGIAEASYTVLHAGIGAVAAVDEATFLAIVQRAWDRPLTDQERAAARLRYQRLVGGR